MEEGVYELIKRLTQDKVNAEGKQIKVTVDDISNEVSMNIQSLYRNLRCLKKRTDFNSDKVKIKLKRRENNRIIKYNYFQDKFWVK